LLFKQSKNSGKSAPVNSTQNFFVFASVLYVFGLPGDLAGGQATAVSLVNSDKSHQSHSHLVTHERQLQAAMPRAEALAASFTLPKNKLLRIGLLMKVKFKTRDLWSVEKGGGDLQEDMMALDVLSSVSSAIGDGIRSGEEGLR
jgi:hypothetical protein